MTELEAFEDLVTNNWINQDKKFKDKYYTYRSKFLSATNPDGVGIGKVREMLFAAKYQNVNEWTRPAGADTAPARRTIALPILKRRR